MKNVLRKEEENKVISEEDTPGERDWGRAPVVSSVLQLSPLVSSFVRLKVLEGLEKYLVVFPFCSSAEN